MGLIMGLSGSDKPTLIRHFNRLIEPTSGRILADGADVLKLSPAGLSHFRRKKASMVFQRFALLPDKTVPDNVIHGLVMDGVATARARDHGMKQIGLVGLAGYESRYPGQLAGGVQQRVGLARALATDAEILLMDEAFSALDPLIRHDMQMQLRHIRARLHKTIVFITHDPDVAPLPGKHIAILQDGQLCRVGTGAGILMAPAQPRPVFDTPQAASGASGRQTVLRAPERGRAFLSGAQNPCWPGGGEGCRPVVNSAGRNMRPHGGGPLRQRERQR
jgi:glycine betaine/proline transport system ATP-binding protein